MSRKVPVDVVLVSASEIGGEGGGLVGGFENETVEVGSTGRMSRSALHDVGKRKLSGRSQCPVEGAANETVPVEVGMVREPRTHETNQGRETKPKTGVGRPGSPSWGTTLTSGHRTGTNRTENKNCWRERHRNNMERKGARNEVVEQNPPMN